MKYFICQGINTIYTFLTIGSKDVKLYEVTRRDKFTETENSLGLPGVGMRGKRGIFTGYKDFAGDNEKVLSIDSGYDYITL